MDKILTIICGILTFMQLNVPNMPIADKHTSLIVSAVLMFLVTGFTAFKQWYSTSIKTSSIWITAIPFAIAIIGGLNDLYPVLIINAIVGQWIRFGITAGTMALNLLSKVYFPATETK